MSLSVKYTSLFTLFALNLIEQPAPVVKIEQGMLSGRLNSEGTVFEYLGIPYASIKERFRAPLPPASWSGLFKAVNEHYHCPQTIFDLTFGNEDCLKINVYVPTRARSNLPVMVYIHGGGFVVGNSGKIIYGPEFLVRHDVIVVTFNYRLGAPGFLCLGIKEAPGNAGLKDQVAALRWIKRNIAAFGGDSDNVTIFGHSAGAGSVSLLVASEATEGLFNKAIVQSGAAISAWTWTLSGVIAQKIVKQFGYDTKDPNEIYRIFSEMPLDNILLKGVFKSIIDLLNSYKIHTPCVENRIPGEEAIITDLPYNMLTRNPRNISMIYGVVEEEGLYLISEETEESLEQLNQYMYHFPDLELPSEEEKEEVRSKVMKFYFGDRSIGLETMGNLSELYGDVYLSVPTILESEIILQNVEAPIYHYFFKYKGGRNMMKDFCSTFRNTPVGSPATHGDDILYLFKSYILPFEFIIKKQDRVIIDWMTKMWTNFAKYGNPTPSFDNDVPVKWEPSNRNSLNFLNIDKEFAMGPLPHPERYMLWKDIYEKYRKTKL